LPSRRRRAAHSFSGCWLAVRWLATRWPPLDGGQCAPVTSPPSWRLCLAPLQSRRRGSRVILPVPRTHRRGRPPRRALDQSEGADGRPPIAAVDRPAGGVGRPSGPWVRDSAAPRHHEGARASAPSGACGPGSAPCRRVPPKPKGDQPADGTALQPLRSPGAPADSAAGPRRSRCGCDRRHVDDASPGSRQPPFADTQYGEQYAGPGIAPAGDQRPWSRAGTLSLEAAHGARCRACSAVEAVTEGGQSWTA
jgi:hypothetical protein